MKRDRETTRFVREENSDLWKIPTPDDSFLTREFSPDEFATALQKLTSAKLLVLTKYAPNLYSMLDLLDPPSNLGSLHACASSGLQKFRDVLWWSLFLSRTNPWTILKAIAQSLCFPSPTRSSKGSHLHPHRTYHRPFAPM